MEDQLHVEWGQMKTMWTKVKLKGLSCMDKLDKNDFGYMSQKKG